MKLIITRPTEDAEALSHKLEALGHSALFAPLLEIKRNEDVEIPERSWAALVVTSANGVRNLQPGKLDFTTRVIAVGPQSAEAARQAGFINVEHHGGDAIRLAQWIAVHLEPKAGPLLYVTGHEISGDLAGLLQEQSFDVVRIETYRAEAVDCQLSKADIQACDGVLLYSPRSAKLWHQQIGGMEALGTAAQLMHYCLSKAVKEKLPEDWPAIVAVEPHEKALLALLEPASKEG